MSGDVSFQGKAAGRRENHRWLLWVGPCCSMMLFYVGEAVVGLSSDLHLDPAATERASGFTFRRSRIAWKMAARLSMLGLPVNDNMWCRLLLGLAVKIGELLKADCRVGHV